MERVAIGLLGELRVTVDGEPLPVTTGQLRTSLAVLALTPGRAVPVRRLAAALWSGDEPAHVRRTVQTYMTRLRRMLGADSIGTTPAGYLLRVAPDAVDAVRFERLLDGSPDPAALTEALALWRGNPFEGVRLNALHEPESRRLVERYVAAVEQRIDLDLAAGNTDELVVELGDLTARHPLRESLWVRLMIALDRCGRPAEALSRYESVRVRIADALGVDPGPELQAVYADLLAGRPAGSGAAQTAGSGAAQRSPARDTVTPVPRQLPHGIDAFVGRLTHLKEMQAQLDDGRSGPAVTTPIVLIHGPAGAGKTALAVHWAHQVAERFPDGQLHLNLRGFDPSESAVEPAEGLRGCFDALGVSAGQIPVGHNAQVGLFRSLLADKRVLLLLDNAHDVGQVRPLLPAGDGCLVLVTSRNQLPGLVSADGAHPIGLRLFAPGEARQLLESRLGVDRVESDPSAVDDIIDRCGRLPLALAVVAARAATHPDFPLAALAAELRGYDGDLDAFAGPDASADVRAAFSWSYRCLPADAARFFRRLDCLPGPAFSAATAASLTGTGMPDVRRVIGELTRAHMLEEVSPGRYTAHDLLRTYAAELAGRHDDAAERARALRRVLDHYTHSAWSAATTIDPHRAPIPLPAARPGVAPERFTGQPQAMAWLTTERPAILAAIDRAVRTGHHDHAWQLAWAVAQFLFVTAQWSELMTVQRTAIETTGALGNRTDEAYFSRSQAMVWSKLGDFDEAHRYLRRAIELYEQTADDAGLANVHSTMSKVLAEQGRLREAIGCCRRAMAYYRASGDRRRAANLLDEIGWYEAYQGNYPAALRNCGDALAVAREVGDEHGAASCFEGVAYAQHHLGRPDEAVTGYEQAIALYRRIGDRMNESGSLARLADAYDALGRPTDADAARLAALSVLENLDDPSAADHRTRVAELRARVAGHRPGIGIAH
jgi:DNA-binding SARP family transcriptional activator/tetratricopeptide (TPR) repeat protein